MTNLHESVYLRFRGRTRRLPLLTLAMVLRRDVARAAEALEILIQGPPETRAAVDAVAANVPAAPAPAALRGEGVGGGVQEQHEQTQMKLSCEQKQEQGEGGAGEGAVEADVVDVLVAQLGSDANRVAIERLATVHSRPLLYEALRRTLRIPPERIRASRSAIFTGIVRKLAAPDSPNQ